MILVKDSEPKPEKLFSAKSTSLLIEFDRYYIRIRFTLLMVFFCEKVKNRVLAIKHLSKSELRMVEIASILSQNTVNGTSWRRGN